MVLVRAEDMGKTGYESKEELDADKAFYDKLESIRQKASPLMGLGDATGKVIPKFGIVSAPKNGSITARYFVPFTCHYSCADLRPATPRASLEDPRLTNGLAARTKPINTLYVASVTLMLGG